jgi:transcriptional regulator GlxA family with amidase domain
MLYERMEVPHPTDAAPLEGTTSALLVFQRRVRTAIVDEILMRLLRSAIGPRLALLGQREPGGRRVTKAVTWVREHFAQPIKVEDLANLANMSLSSFYQHFRAVTAMSPLQCQKVLRLHEARRLMLARMLDAGSAGRQVGYLSAAQFSREYARLFGSAPTRDIAKLRDDEAVAGR